MSELKRVQGGLLGLACGDALGAPLEGRTPAAIARRYPDPAALVADPPGEVLRYTDDTEMALGVAEALRARGREARAEDYARRYVANLNVDRGYGRGALMALAALDQRLRAAGMRRTDFGHPHDGVVSLRARVPAGGWAPGPASSVTRSLFP